MLDQNQIDQFTQKAKAAGYSDEEIATEVERKRAEVQTSTQTTSNLTNPPTVQPQLQQPSEVGSISKPANPLGLTLEQLYQAKSKAQVAGDKPYVSYYQGLIDTEEGYAKANPESDKVNSARDLARSAQAVLDTINLIESGQLTGKKAEDALNFVAGKSYESAFDTAGKNFSARELAILQGTKPTVQETKGNILQRAGGVITGQVPPQTGNVIDDFNTLKTKMNLSLEYANAIAEGRQPNIKAGLGTGQDNNLSEQPPELGDGVISSTGETANLSKPGSLFENVAQNAIDIAKGVPALGETALNLSPAGQIVDMAKGEQIDPLKSAKILVEMGKGLLQNLAQTTGLNENTIGIKDGHFYWNPGQQVKDAFVHDYNHPIDAALWILPFLRGVEGKSGLLGNAAKDSKSFVDNVAVESKAGKAATDIAVPIPESVIKSEEIMGKALQNTKSLSVRGMAKELEGSIATEGEKITARAVEIDKTIGPQPIGEVIDEVMQKAGETSAGKANPDLLKIIEDDLNKQLVSGQLPGGLERGNIEATTVTKMNEARKYFTSNLNSWFENGQPLGTRTNDLNALRWSTASTLKDIIGEADAQGIIRDSLDKQHIAFQTAPVLSKISLTKGAGVGSISYKWGLMRKAWEASGAKTLEAIRIKNARALQGLPPSPPELNAIKNPEISKALPITTFTRRDSPGFWRGRAEDTSRWTVNKLPNQPPDLLK